MIMIIEIEGVVINEAGDSVNVVLVDDTEGTVELEMDREMFDQLRRALNRTHKRSKV